MSECSFKLISQPLIPLSCSQWRYI